MNVQFKNQQTRFPVKAWKALLQETLPEALALLPFGRELQKQGISPRLDVIFAGPNVMRRVNRETRQVDKLTDVLSFPLLDMRAGKLDAPLRDHDFDLAAGGGKSGGKDPVLPLGEIMISLDQAFLQAAAFGHPDEREVVFLSIHGLLHLLGYDHQDQEQEKAMFKWQRQILNALGIGRMIRPGPGNSLKLEEQ